MSRVMWFGIESDYENLKEVAYGQAYNILLSLNKKYLNEIKITKKILEELMVEYGYKKDLITPERKPYDMWESTLSDINEYLETGQSRWTDYFELNDLEDLEHHSNMENNNG